MLREQNNKTEGMRRKMNEERYRETKLETDRAKHRLRKTE